MSKNRYKLLLFLIMPLFAFTGTASADIELEETETVRAGSGVKSVVLSPDGSKVYASNLEGMSVYEFKRENRKLQRKIAFVPHRGKGFNYKTKEEIDSYQEKPVESHITHEGRYLWVSLHNAGGVVVWDLEQNSSLVEGKPFKEAYLYDYTVEPRTKVKTDLLFIETGKTPKIITSSPDGHYLFVANWHSNTVSVFDISSSNPEDWHRIRDIRARIPRGLLVSPDSKTLYIAEMATEMVSIIDIETMKKTREIRVGLNPRHMTLRDNMLYVSLNLGSQMAMVDLETGEISKTDTCEYPRTIALSEPGDVLFSVCYKGDMMQAFSADDLTLIGSWESDPHPVGVDVYSSPDDYIEVWVANYSSGTIKVFTFRKPKPAPISATASQEIPGQESTR